MGSPTANSHDDTPGLRPGRACRNCVKMKEKCLPFDESLSVCRRCYRLKKTCSTPLPVIRGSKRARSQEIAGIQQPTPATTPGLCIRQTNQEPPQAPEISPSLAALPAHLREQLFGYFQDELMPFRPFVTLDFGRHDGKTDQSENGSGAEETTMVNTANEGMRVNSCESLMPFTYHVCLMVSLNRRVSLLKVVARELLSSITQALLINGHKSFDLLQALLILTTSYPYHTVGNPQLNNLIHLAQALTVDLNIANYDAYSGLPDRGRPDVGAVLFGSKQGSSSMIAEWRATLGLYYAQAMFAISLRRLEYPRWSPRLDHACDYLRQNGNQSSDQYGINIVQALRIASHYLVPSPHGIRPSTSLSIRAYTKCFIDELSQFRRTLPDPLLEDRVFQQEVLAVEIALWDLAIDALGATSQPIEGIEALFGAHAALTAFTDNFLALPLETYPLLHMITMGAQFSQLFEVLVRLHCIKCIPAWDMADRPPHTHFSAVAERIAERLEEVFLLERERFPDLDCYMFAVYPIKVRQWKKRFEEVVAQANNQERDHGAQGTGEAASAATPRDSTLPQMQHTFTSPSFDDILQWPFPIEELGWP